MKLVVSKRAQDDYNALSPNLQKRVDKQFSLLLADGRYPSLRAKKYEGMQAQFMPMSGVHNALHRTLLIVAPVS